MSFCFWRPRVLPLVTLLPALVALRPAAAGAAQAQSPATADLADRIRQLADSSRVPGGVVVFVTAGRVDLIVPFGVREGRDSVSAATAFRVASVSKVMTAAAAAVLVARGDLALDRDIRPGYVWLRDRASGAAPVTLRQLLTHTGGFDDRAIGMFAREASAVEPLGRYLARRMPPRTTAPGRSTRYSNHGAALAGLLVADAAGKPFADAVDSLVFRPLGMASSSFAQPLPAALQRRLARAFPCPERNCAPVPLDFRHTVPAGGLVTTAEDMARFLEAVLAGDSSALGPGTVARLTSRAWAARPDLPGLALALQEQVVAGRRALVHAGSSSGYLSLLAVVPEIGAGLFVVTSGGSSRFGAAVMALFEQRLPRGPDAGGGVPRPVGPDSLADYAGSYLLGRAPRASYESFPARFLFGHTVSTTADGYLARSEGGATIRYGRLSGDLFGALDGPGLLAFERNEAGRVVAMQAPDPFNGARYPASYRRLSPLAAPGFMNELLSWVAGLPLIAFAVWGTIEATVRVRRRRRAVGGAAVRRATLTRIGLIVCLGSAATILVFGFGFMARFNAMAATAPGTLAYGLPASLSRLLWLPWLAAAMTAVLVPLAAVAWRKGRAVALRDRVLLAVGTATALIFVLTLVHFSLLPPVG